VSLCGWIQKIRPVGLTFIDLRDRFGITQVTIDPTLLPDLANQVKPYGREHVIQVEGVVTERSAKSPKLPTGDIEIVPSKIIEFSKSKVPPFLIEDQTDGLEELRMKHRYLDIRRAPVRDQLILRHRVAQLTRNYLSDHDFIEVETPCLIKSTPEGARDFVVPSRMNPGTFYALPQSPQCFKQLLMVAGIDRYFQIAKCFRDEELRADRQPEFTQIDCEMSFIEQEDILELFEGFTKYILKEIRGLEIKEPFPRMTWDEAMNSYGIDKPDIRFGMKFVELTEVVKGKGFKLFDDAKFVAGFCAPGAGEASKKVLEDYTKHAKSTDIGAPGLIYVKVGPKPVSTVGKFYTDEDLQGWIKLFPEAKENDLLMIFWGDDKEKTQTALGRYRNYMGSNLKLRDPNVFKPLWVIDFPLLEWNEDEKRFNAMHHPFTSPKPSDIPLIEKAPKDVRANAYDLVLNGVEVGGGSIRIHDQSLQLKMFQHLGFTIESAREQFGFLMDAFEYGAPPHGGLAFGLDRLCSLLGGVETIRDFIAFPKNSHGRDTMIAAPSPITDAQLAELNINVVKPAPK
jgi:aspartyl-tRNA synthetase